MANPFLAEIRIFPFNFPPKGWAFCDGQLLQIYQNTALFSLLGTTYGGDGKSTFALPNVQGSVAIAPGQGPGLSLIDLGESGGEDTVTLLTSEIPAHTHNAQCNSSTADSMSPGGEVWAPEVAGSSAYGNSGGGQMSPQALAPTGASQPHNNLQPYLVLNYCIALQGVYPPRS